jgi:hypothetical protein
MANMQFDARQNPVFQAKARKRLIEFMACAIHPKLT